MLSVEEVCLSIAHTWDTLHTRLKCNLSCWSKSSGYSLMVLWWQKKVGRYELGRVLGVSPNLQTGLLTTILLISWFDIGFPSDFLMWLRPASRSVYEHLPFKSSEVSTCGLPLFALSFCVFIPRVFGLRCKGSPLFASLNKYVILSVGSLNTGPSYAGIVSTLLRWLNVWLTEGTTHFLKKDSSNEYWTAKHLEGVNSLSEVSLSLYRTSVSCSASDMF